MQLGRGDIQLSNNINLKLVKRDNEGGIGAVDALVAPERWALEAEAEAEEPFRFFDDSAIWRSVCRF